MSDQPEKNTPKRSRRKRTPTTFTETVSDAEAVETVPVVTPPAPTNTWLTITAFGVLHVVPAANYLRYGPSGVRRFHPGAAPEMMPHPGKITVTVTIKPALGGEPTLYPDLSLAIRPPGFDLQGTNIWTGEDQDSRLHLSWVWDFYRLYSGVKLTVEVPAIEQDTRWNQTHRLLKTLASGAQIIVEHHSAVGSLLQVYPVDKTAREIHTPDLR